jgi:hypothetical protein
VTAADWGVFPSACSMDTGEVQHCSEWGSGTVLPCGTVAAQEYAAFSTSLQELMSDAQSRTGDRRSAAGGQQGHQRTPAFVYALVRQALEDTKGDHGTSGGVAAAGMQQPRGGFMDVGLHTGGTPRDTAWPLVREAIKVGVDVFISHWHSPHLAT